MKQWMRVVLVSTLGLGGMNIVPVWGEKVEGDLQIKGSDTMVNLGQAFAEAFMQRYPQANIAVTGGGSGTGIAAILNGTCEIAQSSREVKPKELEDAKKLGFEMIQTEVGIDALAVIVHPANSVSQLTISQLSDIFTGKIKNWSAVGGTQGMFLVLSRERNSGTHAYFLEHVVRKENASGSEEFAASVLMMLSSQAIIEEVRQNPSAIGYVGMGYLTTTVKAIAVANDPNGPYVLPELEGAQKGEYPITRPLWFLTRGQPQGLIKTFIAFVLSDEGQKIVRDTDFVPLK